MGTGCRHRCISRERLAACCHPVPRRVLVPKEAREVRSEVKEMCTAFFAKVNWARLRATRPHIKGQPVRRHRMGVTQTRQSPPVVTVERL